MDLKNFVLPTYWDAATLEKYRLADGTTYDQLVADIAGALNIVNGELLSEPLYSGLLSTTDELAIEYPVGDTNGFVSHTEYTKPDAQRGATTGHMLPLNAYDRDLGWTWDFLRKARRTQLDADIASAMKDLRNVWHRRILQRLFTSTFTAVGAAGRSMPLADAGVADPAYIPPAAPERGGTFLATHTHVLFAAGITQANLLTAVGHVWEHNVDGPFDLLISQADLAAWTNTANVTGFVPRADSLIRYGATADLATVDESYIGAVETDYGPCRMRANGRIPTGYWSVYKSYGAGDQRNPMRVRLGEYGVGATLLKAEGIREYPLEHAIMFTEFGEAINDRVGAVIFRNDGGAWADPTIS